MIERRRQLLGPAYKLFYDDPVHIVRGEGVWLYDADGRKYLDMYNNVPHVGHCHPHVVDALTKQIATLNTHTRYLHENILEYAERLTGKFEDELDLAMFCCTGSEANELAMRIARTHTGGTGFIATSFAYHGNTKATFEITTSDIPDDERPDFIATVPVPDPYRGPYAGAEAGEKYAAHVHEAIDELGRRGVKLAAFIIDTIASSGGVVSPPPGYLSAVAQIVRDAGGLFIADEVQPGFGRTGRNFWGYQADGFVARRHRHPQRHRRGVCGERAVLQHLRRQPGVLRRGPRGPRRAGTGEAAAKRARSRPVPGRRPLVAGG
jgi:4-aminobutyrate aminotransferase-like enzyme